MVVIEACTLAGWVHDLCAELGFPNQSLPRLNANPDQEQDYLSCYSAEDMTVLRKRFAAEEEFLRRLRAEGRLHRAAPDPSPAT